MLSGDAVVAFSRKDIFSIKKEIESKTPHKCCVIYGSLPQETRAHQVAPYAATTPPRFDLST
ncbi:unnamed protein product [Ectocarpus sp. CCAP 1310/34]|nr:unnamed protein product [Ectocarpus sp. CCAP 1310/34]